MQLPLHTRTPIDAAFAERVERELAASIAGRPLADALAAYDARMDALLREALQGTSPACAAGCTPCCHQPLLVSFLDLGRIVFADEARFTSRDFLDRVHVEIRQLQRWRREGLKDAGAIASRQFADQRRCLLLGADDRCTAYDARPFLCRNAFALERCSFESLETFGFGDLAALARRLRAHLHSAYALSRFDTPRVKTERAAFYLPEGLAWFVSELPLDELRPLFRSRSG